MTICLFKILCFNFDILHDINGLTLQYIIYIQLHYFNTNSVFFEYLLIELLLFNVNQYTLL